MRTFLRNLKDNRGLWRAWLPLVVLAGLLPPVGLAMPLVEKQLIDGVVLARRPDLLVTTVGLYAGLWVLSTVLGASAALLRVYLNEEVTLRLRRRLFVHCERLSVAFAHREHSGRTTALFVNDAPALAGLLSTTVAGAIGSLGTVVIGAGMMASLSWPLALVAGILPPLLAALAAVVTRPLRPASRRAQEKAAELNEHLHESLSGMREVVAFGHERSQRDRFTITLRELLRLRVRLTVMDTAIGTGQSVLSLAVTLVIAGYGGYLVIHDQATLGTLVAMQSLFGYVFPPAGQIAGLVAGVQKGLASADRLYAFLDEQPRIQERPTARDASATAGALAFDRVSFGYQPDRLVLHEVSFSVRPGQLLALVGPSGAGKSTLASLLARFYDPTEGRVLLEGIDLRNLTLAGLRRHIGMVFQDTFLFATTVGQNIALGRPDATLAEIEAAARAAHAWEFIEQLPHGLDTHVGERGVRLSEGQKQRLAIARAFLRDPAVLILDEPTSALDARSENLLQSALERLMRGRTTVVIAHRLATVQRADQILVLDAGRVVERGTHHELLARRGLYRELFDLQFGSTEHVARDCELVTVA